MTENNELDLDLDQIEQNIEIKNRYQQRYTDLAKKAKLASDEKEVDSVAINMQKTDLKSFETLFYQLDFIMTKKSSVVVVSNSDISAIPLKYGFVRYTEAVLGWNSTLKISCFSR